MSIFSFRYSARFLWFFFFSSRRRHTRLVSDWSSDVCSSDLAGWCRSRPGPPIVLARHIAHCRRPAAAQRAHKDAWLFRGSTDDDSVDPQRQAARRSEERRVGKECRAQGVRGQYDKKTEKNNA